MLNGIEPILIFQFSKLSPSAAESVSKIPIVSSIVNTIGLPPIPLYLSEKLTGLYIDAEDKNIDIETTTETLSTGGTPIINQKAINSTVKIQMVASKDSIGLTLLSAIADLILPKVTSKEYSITYLHGAVTVFGGLLHSFAISQNSTNDLYNVTLELTKSSGEQKKGPPEVEPVAKPITLSNGSISSIPPTAPITSAPIIVPPTPAAAPPPVAIPRAS